MTVIAAVEAYRLTGWESTQKCLVDLYHDFLKVADASKKVEHASHSVCLSLHTLPPPSLSG
jgi:hypothetical protein